ncbi:MULTISPECIES: hypothetical protein [unclassified Methylobacterium]|uniref:hypothetical protein n=1 Tax=unclassified Methylobacterium TaxID=2615210 RepID=UPI002269F7BC|nr:MULTISPECIES: hypothetical protein [unclassified Methylobacterium]
MWKSINLDVAEGVIKHARRLLSFSATLDSVRDAAFLRASYHGDEYADRCRFGHTFEGSFGFAIESPVGPHTEALMGPDDTPPPERRYIQRLVRGFHIIKRAEVERNPRLIVESFGEAFNANMCDEIEKLIRSSSAGAITSSFNFSPEWTTPADLPFSEPIKLGLGVLPILREASAALKHTDVDPDQTVMGPVILLSSRENPADLEHTTGSREFAIEHQTEDGLVMVRLRVDPLTYRAAYEAHGSGLRVSARGKVEQKRRTWFLRELKHFKII